MDFSRLARVDWKRVASSVDLQEIWTRFLSTFVSDVQSANSRFAFSTDAYKSEEFQAVLIVVVLSIVVDVFSSFVLSRKRKSSVLLFITEVLALSKVLLVWFVPTTPMRFGFALVFFASGLGIHSRVCDQVQTDMERPDGSWNRFWFEAFNTQYFNILSRMTKFGVFQSPPFLRTLHCAVLLVLIDTCTYVIREWIPDRHNISAVNQTLAQAIVGGVWALFCMEFLYGAVASQFDLMGIPLPMELRHRHPLLSESLKEFWGIRWNPIVGKLLQDSFYKPLKRLKVSRTGCVLACFTGSALLHALPQYIATRDLTDCYMMFGFFFLQGVGLMVEILVQRMCGFAKKSKRASVPALKKTLTANTSAVVTSATSNSSNRDAVIDASDVSESDISATESSNTQRVRRTTSPAVVYKTAPYQFITEMLTVGCILSTAYIILEGVYGVEARLSAQKLEMLVRVAVSCAAGATMMFYFVRQHVYITLSNQSLTGTVDKTSDKPKAARQLSLKKFFFSVVGWAWVVSSIMVLLPLFSLPVLHAVQPLYAKSFVVGSIVRTFEKVVLPEVLKMLLYIYW